MHDSLQKLVPVSDINRERNKVNLKMEYYRRLYGVALILLVKISIVDGRELRPSEHGLTFQNTSAAVQESPEMLSFFGRTESKVPLPEARNLSVPSWGSSGGGGRRGGGGGHVWKVWLVASLVCGITGVALLVVAAFIFIFRFQKHPSLDK